MALPVTGGDPAVLRIGARHAKPGGAVVAAPMHVDRRVAVGIQPPVGVDVRGEQRHRRRDELLQAGDEGVEERRVLAVRLGKQIPAGFDVDDALMQVHGAAGLVLHRLCHEGGVHLVAERRLADRPRERRIRREGEEELARSPQALAWSGLAAGLSMGFSLIAQGYLQAALPDTGWRVLVVKLGYSVGFLVVILGRQQLFTENTLTPVLPLLHDVRGKVVKVAKLWGVVLAANLVGTGLFAWALSAAPHVDAETQRAFLEIARDVYRGDFFATFVAAIYAGWLIALMVWMLPFAQGGRVVVIVILTYLIGLGHLDHSIAGSVEVLYLVAEGEVGFMGYLGHFLVPAVLGNIVGGVGLVAVLNHAQVVHNEGA